MSNLKPRRMKDVIRRRKTDNGVDRVRIARRHRVKVGDRLHQQFYRNYKDCDGNDHEGTILSREIFKQMVRKMI